MKDDIVPAGIYWVSFARSVGHEYQGRRPAVVIQSDASLKRTNLVTIMPLTSKIRKPHDDDVLVKATAQNKLYGDSLVKVHHIESFDRSRFIKKIGVLEEDDLLKIRAYLKIHFGL